MEKGYCEGLIKQEILADCANPVVGGLEQKGVIINFTDIDRSKTKFDATRPNVVTDLVLKASAKGYQVIIPTNQPFNGTNTTMEEGTNRNSFTNNVGMVILDNSPDVCGNVIDGLASGKFVVVLENQFKNTNKTENAGDSTYQIFGFYQGLKATTLENDKYSEDTEGGWNVVLTETKAPKSALFLYKEDLETTTTAFESLTA